MNITDNTGQVLHIGDTVLDESGQNGTGVITKISFGQIQADWTSHRFEGIVRGWIGIRWVRRVATVKEPAKTRRLTSGK